MGMSQIIIFVVVLVGIGVFWWMKYGRHGGGGTGWMRKQLGLAEGEEIASMWMGYYHIEKDTGDKVGEVFGVHTRGVNLMIALTNTGRLAIGHNEGNNPPMGFNQGQVAVSLDPSKPEYKKLTGASGMEPAVVMQLEPAGGGQSVQIQIARSGFDAIQAWAGASA